MSGTSQNRQLFEDYEGFVEKFKPKLTTDDCYTPKLIYEAVADWVAAEYGLSCDNFVRPFYPGGNYEAFNYNQTDVVVDNPPFSILSKIIYFYVNQNIKFFLFAPTLAGLIRYSDVCTALVTGVDITYENGAAVTTSFVTNLENRDIRIKTAPSLCAAVKAANDKNRKEKVKFLPKYSYPPELVTSAMLYQYSKHGIEFVIPRSESARVGRLDAQVPLRKGIYGSGLLLSERLTAEREKAEREKAEREKAEREKAERFCLSIREKELVKFLNPRTG